MEDIEVTVQAVRDVGGGTVALELTAPEGFDALPGQFVLLRAVPDDEELARHYTLSSPTVDETFEITVGIDPDGDLSPWLADREPGDAVRIDGPFGRISYEGDGDVVAVAGGPGVGPAVAIAEAARANDRDAVVVYQDDDHAHLERLEALERDGATVEVLDGDRNEALRGAVEEHLEAGRVYVFGFSDFVTFVADAIEDAGGDPDEALIENFG
ncbi:ferredoxin--NADP reductase [Natrialbaceae archaeon GCM10025810]|uniref:ferredoxin--NADP reductase n=1 Tax=Halovalidus salilacus TaxID=3075124 RepID=UPI00361B3EF3